MLYDCIMCAYSECVVYTVCLFVFLFATILVNKDVPYVTLAKNQLKAISVFFLI